MANWALTCKRCGKDFTHSKVGETAEDRLFPSKPKFPPEGLAVECPNCKTTSSYQQRELTYRSE